MTRKRIQRIRAMALVAACGLALTACGGAKVGASGNSSVAAGTKPCGTVQLAVNPWVGYEADAAVVSYVLTNRLGCKVTETNLSEQVSWQGFASGQIDVILENWGHEDLAKTYITQQKVAEDFGPQGNQGIIGWFVPAWMAQQYPDITNWKNLNKYANLFQTPASGSQGQLLDGDPSYVTNDVALVKNLNLNYKVVVGGSEATLIKSLQTATQQKKPLLFYFYEPQWAISLYPIARVNLPPYTPGCDAVATKVACDYPPYVLNKVVRTAWANSGSPAVTMIKNFKWTNDDQNQVAEYIANQNMSDAQAAKKWVDANPDKVNAWLQGTS